jgi:hypothetical protein
MLSSAVGDLSECEDGYGDDTSRSSLTSQKKLETPSVKTANLMCWDITLLIQLKLCQHEIDPSHGEQDVVVGISHGQGNPSAFLVHNVRWFAH